MSLTTRDFRFSDKHFAHTKETLGMSRDSCRIEKLIILAAEEKALEVNLKKLAADREKLAKKPNFACKTT